MGSQNATRAANTEPNVGVAMPLLGREGAPRQAAPSGCSHGSQGTRGTGSALGRLPRGTMTWPRPCQILRKCGETLSFSYNLHSLNILSIIRPSRQVELNLVLLILYFLVVTVHCLFQLSKSLPQL